MQEMWNIFLPLRRKRLLIACPTTKGNNNDLTLLRHAHSINKWTGARQRGSHREAGSVTYEIPSAASDRTGKFNG